MDHNRPRVQQPLHGEPLDRLTASLRSSLTTRLTHGLTDLLLYNDLVILLSRYVYNSLFKVDDWNHIAFSVDTLDPSQLLILPALPTPPSVSFRSSTLAHLIGRP